MRIQAVALPLLLGVSAVAFAHSGVGQLQPGEPFPVYEMKALVPDEGGIYQRRVIDFNKLRDGSALVFIAIDPVVKTDVAEGRRFLALLKTLHNTHAFFVLPPGRSMRPDDILPALQKASLELPFIIDDRDFFPYAFQYNLGDTPRYQLFDGTQTLVIRSASTLSQRMPSGLTLTQSLRALDKGQPVAQATFAARKENVPPSER